jgi:undecaprenyl-diphosphatase
MNLLDQFDHQIMQYFFINLLGRWEITDWILKILAVYLIYLVPIILLALWFWSSEMRKLALRSVGAGLYAWLVVSNLIGLLYFRQRPLPSQTIELFFHQPDKSFPSDHAAFLFGIVFSFYLAKKYKMGNLLLVISLVISMARVVAGIHFCFDIIAGALIGFLIALIFYLGRNPIDRVLSPLIVLAKKIRLA